MSLLKISIWIFTISNSLANKLGLTYGKYLNTLSKSWIIANSVSEELRKIAFSLLGIIAFSVSEIAFSVLKIAFSPLGIIAF